MINLILKDLVLWLFGLFLDLMNYIVLLYARGRLYYIVIASHVKKRYNELIIMWYYVLLWIRPHFA